MSGTSPELDAIITDRYSIERQWLADGTIAFTVWGSTDAATLRQLTGPGQAKPIGALGHVANVVSLSKDLARATIMWREYRGDAWMYRVVKP